MALPAPYLNEITSRNDPRVMCWVEIEGLEWGLASHDLGLDSSLFSARWADRGVNGPKGVKHTLLRPPSPFEVSIDPKQAVANISQTQFQTHDVDLPSGPMLVQAMAVQRADNFLSLAADLTEASTTIAYFGEADTSVYPLTNGIIYIGGETIAYTTHDTVAKQFTGCTRGVYRSRSYPHKRFTGYTPVITPYPRSLRNRRVWIYFSRRPEAVPDGDTEATAYDSSGNGNHGTKSNVTRIYSPSSGFGGACEFNGSSSKITGPTTIADALAVAVPKYMRLSGASGTYASTPDSAALDITGDIDLRACAAAADWTSQGQTFVAKHVASGNQAAYLFGVQASGVLHLGASVDGTLGNRKQYNSTVAIDAVDGAKKHARVTLDVDNGSSQSVATFYTSDDGVTWTQLGATVTAAVTSIFASTAAAEVGAHDAGTSWRFVGKIYSAEIRNGIDGTVVAKFNAEDGTAGGTSFVSSATGETWTLNGAAAIADKELGPFTLECRARSDVATGVGQVIVTGVRSGIGSGQHSFAVGMSSGNHQFSAFVRRAIDGGDLGLGAGPSPITAGVNYVVAIDYDGSTLRTYVDGVHGASITLSGIALPSAPVAFTVGARASNVEYFDGVIDEVRLSNVARYAGSNYAPSSTPFVADANTILLYHFDRLGDDALRFRGVIVDYPQDEGGTSYTIQCEHDLRRLDQQVAPWLAQGKILGRHARWKYPVLETDANGNLIPRPGVEVAGGYTEIPYFYLEPGQWRLLWPALAPGDVPDTAPEATPFHRRFVKARGSTYPKAGLFDDGFMLIRVGDDAALVGVPLRPGAGVSVQDRLYVKAWGFYYHQARDGQHPADDTEFHEVYSVGLYGVRPPAGQTHAGEVIAPRTEWSHKSYHPIDMMLAHLVSDGTPNTVRFDDGSNDWFKWFGLTAEGLGVNDGYVGLKYGGNDIEIDIQSFKAIRDVYLPNARVGVFLDAPFTLKEYLVRNCLKPHGLFWTYSADMRLKLKQLATFPGIDAALLPLFDSSKIRPEPAPRWEANARNAYAGIRVRSSWKARQEDQENIPEEQRGVIATKFFTDNAFTYGSEAEWIEIETDNRWIDERNEHLDALIGLYNLRYSFPAARVLLSTHWHDLHDVEVGDAVRLTLPNVPDIGDGTLGMVDRICYVVSKRLDDFAARIDWVLEVGVGQAGRYARISPAAECFSLPSSNTIQFQANAYTSAPAQDLSHFRANDKVAIYSQDMKTKRGSVTIQSIDLALNRVTFTTDWPVGTNVAGLDKDIMVFDDYATVRPSGTIEQLRYGFLADANEDLAPGSTVADDRDTYKLL